MNCHYVHLGCVSFSTVIFMLKMDKCAVKLIFNAIQDGGGKRQNDPRTCFFPVTSTNVRISSQKFLTFSFNTFATLM